MSSVHWAVADFNQLHVSATARYAPREQWDPETHTTDGEDLLMALNGANNAGHQLSIEAWCEHRLLTAWHLKPQGHVNKSAYLFPLMRGGRHKGSAFSGR